MRYVFMRFPDGKPKAVTLSYDDGNLCDIKLSDIVSKYNMKCTFNINRLGPEMSNKMTAEDVQKYILSRGHEIAVHGYHHVAEGTMRAIDGIQDVLNCRLELERTFGIIVRGMAYPDSGITYFTNGASFEKVKNYLTELDIAYSRTLAGDNNSFALPEDWHRWMPTAHHNNGKLMDYIDEFLSLDMSRNVYRARRQPRLFYLWGHAYEFDNDNSWDYAEEICKKLSDAEDVWYATNIEIYDYVEAYKSLVFSADGKIVYNPTVLTIWFDIDGELYSIKSGETLKIN